VNTPKYVAKAIEPITKGKVFCDLGCNDGSFLKAVKAKKKFGIDKYEENCEIVRKKGIDCYCQDVKDGLPEADVYYNFTHHYEAKKALELLPKGKIMIFGATKEKMKDYPEEIKKIRINIDKWQIAIVCS